MTHLEQILRNIALNLIANESYVDFLSINNIHPEDWPQGRVKDIAERYLNVRLQSGHGPAAIDVARETDFLNEAEFLTYEPSVFIAAYRSEIKQHRGKLLALKIAQDPENYEMLFSQAKALPQPDEDYFSGQSIEIAYERGLIEHSEGIAERQIEGWHHLSTLVSGFNGGRVGMILAATGFGKTTLALNLALAASKSMSVYYLNMEMSFQDFTEKIIVSEARLNYFDYKRNMPLYREQAARVMSDHLNRKLHYTGGRAMSVSEIIARCTARSRKTGLDLVVVDYDQKLILQQKANFQEWKALQDAVVQLEQMAQVLNCCVLVLAQENKEGGISGSQRSTFPATFVLRFFQDEETQSTLIEALKSRFTKKSKIEVKYKPEMSYVEEIGPYIFESSEKATRSKFTTLFPAPPPRGKKI